MYYLIKGGLNHESKETGDEEGDIKSEDPGKVKGGAERETTPQSQIAVNR